MSIAQLGLIDATITQVRRTRTAGSTSISGAERLQ